MPQCIFSLFVFLLVVTIFVCRYCMVEMDSLSTIDGDYNGYIKSLFLVLFDALTSAVCCLICFVHLQMIMSHPSVIKWL